VAGAFLQKFCEIFCRKAPGGPAARQQGDRLPRPYISVEFWLTAVAGSKIRQSLASLPPSLSFLDFWNFSDANEEWEDQPTLI